MKKEKKEKKGKNKRDYAISEAGEIYIRAQDCGIPTLILLVDEIPFTKWNGDKTLWIRVSVVIDWYKREILRGLERNYSKEEIETYRNNVKVLSEEKLKLEKDSKTNKGDSNE